MTNIFEQTFFSLVDNHTLTKYITFVNWLSEDYSENWDTYSKTPVNIRPASLAQKIPDTHNDYSTNKIQSLIIATISKPNKTTKKNQQ